MPSLRRARKHLPLSGGMSYTQGTSALGHHWMVVALSSERLVGTFSVTGATTVSLNLAYTTAGTTSQPSTDNFGGWPVYWGAINPVTGTRTGALNVITRWLNFDMGSADFLTNIMIDGVSVGAASSASSSALYGVATYGVATYGTP